MTDRDAIRQRNEQAFNEGIRARREQIATALVLLAAEIQAGTASTLIENQAVSLLTTANGIRPIGIDIRTKRV